MNKKVKIVTIVLAVFVFLIVLAFVTPTGHRIINGWTNALAEADEGTLYKNRKIVEDTCRSMIASYHADILTYEQYRNSAVAEERGWAEQARMRANRTATSYNDYVLKNSHVWAENVPSDIEMFLITY